MVGGIGKKVRRVNPGKVAQRENKSQSAAERRQKANRKGKDAATRKAKREARKRELQNKLQTATEEEAPGMKMELDELEKGLAEDDKEMKEAEDEEKIAEKEEDDASKMDVEDEVDGPVNGVEGTSNDPNRPLPSVDSQSASRLAEALQKGLRLGQPPEVIDITAGVMLRDSQAIICCKGGFAKSGIVLENEIPEFPIYRIRNDLLISEDCPDLMDWRRAGKVKGPRTNKKWCVDDISQIQGIAIAVPPRYEGNPEDLIRLLPKLSGKLKDELKAHKKPIPKLPDVQLLIEWKVGIMVENKKGEKEERFTSWESRSGCRVLWKKHEVADKFLLDWGTAREVSYRKAGGKHSSEERSMSPVEIPPAAPTPPGGTPDPGLTPTPESTPKTTPQTTPENTPPPVDKPVQNKPVDPAKTALKEFESKFRMLEDIEADAKLTPAQKGEMIEAFDAYWAKQKAK